MTLLGDTSQHDLGFHWYIVWFSKNTHNFQLNNVVISKSNNKKTTIQEYEMHSNTQRDPNFFSGTALKQNIVWKRRASSATAFKINSVTSMVYTSFFEPNTYPRISSSKAPKIQDAHERKHVLSEPCRVKRIACEKHARTSTSGQKCSHQTWLNTFFDWPPLWHIFWHIFWILYYIYSVTLYLTPYLAVYLTMILTFCLAFYLAYILTFYLAFYLRFYLAFYLTYVLAFFLALCLAFYPIWNF